TEATVASCSYLDEFYKIDQTVRVFQQPCPLLVPIVESGELDSAGPVAQAYIESLLRQDSRIDTILLGCTHYALVENEIRSHTPKGIQVVSQGPIVAKKLAEYLRRHPEMQRRRDRSGNEIFRTTECSSRT